MIFAPKSWLLILFGAALYAYMSAPRTYPSNYYRGIQRADMMRLQVNNPKPR